MVAECKTCRFLSGGYQSILDTKYWVVVLEPTQGYLGQCFVNLKVHKADLAELSDAEWQDFSAVIKKLEGALRSAFNPELFNWTCLMNNAFQASPPKPHVHWSVVPRYSQPVIFNGTKFADPQFGRHYDAVHRLELSDEQMASIREEIKKHL